MKKTIAHHMIDILKENERSSVWYGDIEEIDECAKRAGLYEKETKIHPILINNRVLSALDRSSFFKKGYVKHIGRPARCFFLVESGDDK
ncbi:hypothetical protein ACFQZE_06615 [Paenibacillus sp. GCM10027627]|uniref:hypothetical protein n=1 Tax=unclassified Paenibacillus TaxID=185978 RepID=UPI00362FB1A7